MEFPKITKQLINIIALTTFVFCTSYSGAVSAEPTKRFIVKYKDPAQIKARQSIKIQKMMERLSGQGGTSLRHLRRMALKDRHVITVGEKQDRAKFKRMMRLLRLDPNVISVEEDVLMQHNLVPNDEFYSLQWHYFETTGGINAETAWDTHDGTDVVVAVIDTGITDHSDLNANILPGFDFIGDLDVANDGDGRDSDPSDPGDWVAAFECGTNFFASNSSWHGTHTAGTIAAISGNSQGVTGVAHGAKIVPVRVLGKCGGFLSDIADGIIWASGGTVSGVPANANPAQVINMSLGGSGACDATYQDAIDVAVANGTTVVVSAGNSAADSVNFRPASCNNVINVAANDREGNLASYSNFGSIIDVTAPGGETDVAANGVASTLNDGTEGPGAETYVYYQGTSMAAPHVAGVAALLYQANPNITPAEVEAALIASARPMPGSCSGGCGAGIIDARVALDSLTGGANIAPTSTFNYSVIGSDATFSDNSSDSDGTIDSWLWDFDDGETSVEQNPIHSYATDGSYAVSLTVVDDQGASSTSTQTVTIVANNVAPISSFSFDLTGLQAVFIDGSSDNDGTVDAWAWDFGDGTTSTSQNPIHDYGSDGTYTVQLTVTDNQGAINTSSQNVTLVAPNAAPVSGFEISITDLVVAFTDTSSDSDGTITSWNWDFGDGSSSTEQNPTNTYLAAGNYSVDLTVTDNDGTSNTSTQALSVNEGGQNTDGFTETGLSPARGESLSFNIDVPAGATALDIEVSAGSGDVDLVVNFGSTPTRFENDCLERGAGNIHSCSFDNPAEGTWFIVVRGAQASSGVQLDAYWSAANVGNIAPTASFSFSTADLLATFTDASTDIDGNVSSFSWDFGDGSSSSEQNPLYSYAVAGTYTVSLSVTDNEGASNTNSQSVTVTEAGNGTSGGFTETGISPTQGESISYTIDVPAGASSLEVDLSGGTGNADLAINFGSTPTRNDNDCLENSAGNEHNCTVLNPTAGTWFIIVRGAQASSDVQLDAYWFNN